jgi:hypothetical protein
MPNLPILPPRPAILGSANPVLRLFFDGICPLFLNLPAGRATFAMPRIPAHDTRLVLDPFGTPVFLPLEGHFEISVKRPTGEPNALNTFDPPNDDRAFSNIVDIESQLHGAPLSVNREAIRASVKITEGQIYSARLTEKPITFVKKGDLGLTSILEQKAAKIIGVEISVSAGDIISIVRNGDSDSSLLFFEIKPGQSFEILIGNMCEMTERRAAVAEVAHDFELVYEMVDKVEERDRIVPSPGPAMMGEVGSGPVECWSPRFGMTSDLPD